MHAVDEDHAIRCVATRGRIAETSLHLIERGVRVPLGCAPLVAYAPDRVVFVDSSISGSGPAPARFVVAPRH